jgi:hypothetical protein
LDFQIDAIPYDLAVLLVFFFVAGFLTTAFLTAVFFVEFDLLFIITAFF